MAAIATAEEIATIRIYLPPDATANGWDDVTIAERWTGGVVSTLRLYWFERVNDTAGYLDLPDPGGTLPITQIHRQAKDMLAYYDAYLKLNGDVLILAGARGTRIGKIRKRYVRNVSFLPPSYPASYSPYQPTD